MSSQRKSQLLINSCVSEHTAQGWLHPCRRTPLRARRGMEKGGGVPRAPLRQPFGEAEGRRVPMALRQPHTSDWHPPSALDASDGPSSQSQRLEPLAVRGSRTGWGLDVPTRPARQPLGVFSGLGVPPVTMQNCMNSSLYIAKWQAPAPGWGADLLPKSPRGHRSLSATLGITPLHSDQEKRELVWTPVQRSNCKPPARDPIIDSPLGTPIDTSSWRTSSSAFGSSGRDWARTP